MNKLIRVLSARLRLEHWIVLGFILIGINNIIGRRPGVVDGWVLEISGWYLLIGGCVIVYNQLFTPRFLLKHKRVVVAAWAIMAAGLLAAGVVTVVWYAYIPWSIAFFIRAYWLNEMLVTNKEPPD